MRTPQALLQNRIKKCPHLRELYDRLPELTIQDIDQAPIRPGDRKLLKRALPAIQRQNQIQDIVSRMPRHEVKPEMNNLWLYQGPDTQYDHFEVPTGTVISLCGDMVRFDHYRIKLRQPVNHLLSQCEPLGEFTQEAANQEILRRINQRHGVVNQPVEQNSNTNRMFSARDFW